MKTIARFLLVLFFAVSALAQEQQSLSTRNPLDELHDEFISVLADAGAPFTEEQNASIVLALEESRRASEDLFGEVMDFRSGPPTGERLDRARAGIQWMNDDFTKRVRQYLTAPQLAAWEKHVAAQTSSEAIPGAAGVKDQVQQIRLNNNPFTTENQYCGFPGCGGSYAYAGGDRNEVIQRGGAGAFHGNASFNFKDESLNARNPFASNKPPYQQRNINVNVSGPLIRNRLTLGGNFNQNMQENVDTVHAETPTGLYELGVTRPFLFRNFNVNGAYQIKETQSLQFGVFYGMNRRMNQGVGGFNLPDRASNGSGGNKGFNVRHLWFASDRIVHDLAVNINENHDQQAPATAAVSINVQGAFNGGGSQDDFSQSNRNYNLRSLFIFTGARWTGRIGAQYRYFTSSQISRPNFLGQFTFSDLESYIAKTPITYKVTRGEPKLDITQNEWSVFLQNDLKVSDRSTVFFGLRYDGQSNLDDRNNLDPRLALAYAMGKSTVLRAGVGLFHLRFENFIVRDLLRLDGTRQYEIVVNDPSYPDPFQNGDVSVVPPSSRRIRAKDVTAPYNVNSSITLERTLPRNLFVTASFDHQRLIHMLRSRDVNAALLGGFKRPDPSQGNIWQLESTGLGTSTTFRVTMRQRFRILNVNANYQRETTKNDSDGPFSTPSDNYVLAHDIASWRNHRLGVSVNAQLPWSVFLTGNFNANTGNVYNVTTGNDENQDGVTNDRPAGEPRNNKYGPGNHNFSFNISKAFRFGDPKTSSTNLNFFANLNNAFNRTNLGTPSGVMTSSFYGKSNNAFNPREIEVGLRFQF